MKKIAFLLSVAINCSFFASAPPKHALFVVMGGYNSCSRAGRGPAPANTGVFVGFSNLSKKIKSVHTQMEVSYLASCLHSSPPPDGEASYITSHEPTLQRSGSASVLMNEAEGLSRDDSTTFIIGHSYGGWLTMYMTEKLRLKSSIKGIVTIDPISPACGPVQFIFGGAACKKGPADLNNKAIRSAVGEWLNIYQTDDSSLHSSKIDEAKNLQLSYRGPHTDIDDDKRTWAAIEKMVLASLSQ